MIDVIVGLVILVIVGSAVIYIVRQKRKGVTCIGCSCAGSNAKSHKHGGEGCCGDGCGSAEHMVAEMEKTGNNT